MRFIGVGVLLCFAVPTAFAQTSVLTQDYDNARSGASLPTFPGRAWLDPAQALGTGTTDYSVTNSRQFFWYWIVDQPAGIPANFDNALGVINLGKIYKCP